MRGAASRCPIARTIVKDDPEHRIVTVGNLSGLKIWGGHHNVDIIVEVTDLPPVVKEWIYTFDCGRNKYYEEEQETDVN
jgi:hypothetical protein